MWLQRPEEHVFRFTLWSRTQLVDALLYFSGIPTRPAHHRSQEHESPLPPVLSTVLSLGVCISRQSVSGRWDHDALLDLTSARGMHRVINENETLCFTIIIAVMLIHLPEAEERKGSEGWGRPNEMGEERCSRTERRTLLILLNDRPQYSGIASTIRSR